MGRKNINENGQGDNEYKCAKQTDPTLTTFMKIIKLKRAFLILFL